MTDGKTTRVQVLCPRCKQPTSHEVVHEATTGRCDEANDWFETEQYQIVRCCGCGYHSYRTTYHDSSWTEDCQPAETLWPPRLQKRVTLAGASQLPRTLQQVYRETNAAITSSQPILAAVGIRALVEAVCKHKKAKGRTLKARIDNLVTRGVVTKAQARVLHKTRFLGNKAAHESAPARPDVLDAAMQIAENMLTSVYLLPNIAKAMRER